MRIGQQCWAAQSAERRDERAEESFPHRRVASTTILHGLSSSCATSAPHLQASHYPTRSLGISLRSKAHTILSRLDLVAEVRARSLEAWMA